MKLGIGLYGSNGHQVAPALVNHPHAELVAIAGIDPQHLPEPLRQQKIKSVARLEDLLTDPRVELVSLCSPRRRYQASDAIRCLQAGKHVYAEKPVAMVEADLDAILSAAQSADRQFHDQSTTTFAQPYQAMRECVKTGALGTIVQIIAQKSYPMHDRRPQDEEIDGGLLCQAGIHAVRMVEQTVHLRVDKVTGLDTKLGNPRPDGQLRMAAAMIMTLENGGLATITANYLNPHAHTKIWGYEVLRIFGTQGVLETFDDGRKARLMVKDQPITELDTSAAPASYLDMVIAAVQGRGDLPWSLEHEMHATRVVLRAKLAADTYPGRLL